MSARRRGSTTSCSTLSGKKKPVAVSSENGVNGKPVAEAGAEAGRRLWVPLGNVTNQKREILLVPCAAAKGKTTSISITSSSMSTLPAASSSKSAPGIPSKRTLPKRDEIAPQPAVLEAPRSICKRCSWTQV